MTGQIGEIEAVAQQNTDYLHVIFTAPLVQLAVMCLRPGEQTGTDSPEGAFRSFRVESGEAKFVSDHLNEERTVRGGERLVVSHGGSASRDQRIENGLAQAVYHHLAAKPPGRDCASHEGGCGRGGFSARLDPASQGLHHLRLSHHHPHLMRCAIPDDRNRERAHCCPIQRD